MAEIILNDLHSQETLNDPIAFYRRLREQEPLSHFQLNGVKNWIIAATYDETLELLKDPRLLNDRYNIPSQEAPQQPYGGPLALLSRNMLSADPPDHTRLRKLVSQAFTPRMIEQLRPRIQQITNELLFKMLWYMRLEQI